MKKFSLVLLSILLTVGIISTVHAQDAPKENAFKKSVGNTDSTNDKSSSKINPYDEVITKHAVSDSGLFTIHAVDDKYYFELPKDILEKEILVVSRISGFAKSLIYGSGGAGMRSRPQQVIRWQKKDDKILIRSVSYQSIAEPNKPIYKSVINNNFEPIIMAFDIKAINKDSLAYVIEINELFTTDIAAIGPLKQRTRKKLGIGGLDTKRCLINSIKAFPKNIEVRHLLTYKGNKIPNNLTNTLTVEMNQSFIALPEIPMQQRYNDARVSYFSIEQIDYGLEDHVAAKQKFINRWRLEPMDMDAYLRGELVEPVKPIVYYLDPATPEKWRPFIKQGVNDWQIAFEKAGFKNAIICKDPPSKEEDPDWSPEDVRYSVIRYITAETENAMGPHVHDPRTGEILESDILWYHNIMNLLRNWYFVQTAAVNEDARSPKFKDEVMGQLMRFVATHEVGHTLGLPHNFVSSSAYPVDSLRSPSFTSTHGTAPSIMDYARFNYIAQPGDGVTQLNPAIGEYDIWSIIYGYKLIPDTKTPEEEKPILNEWIKERADNPVFRFGYNSRDPLSQSEDLGDDAIKASTLGIANLKRIVPNLVEWTTESGEDYGQLKELYKKVLNQFEQYGSHVTANIGGVYEHKKTSDQDGFVYTPVSKTRQRAAIRFMNEQVFRTPSWLINEDIYRRIDEPEYAKQISQLQSSALKRLLSSTSLNKVLDAQGLYGNNAYSLIDLIDDVEKDLFSELYKGDYPDAYRRILQRTYVDHLAEYLNHDNNKNDHSDIRAIARGNLERLAKRLKPVQKKIKGKNRMAEYHIKDIESMIKTALQVQEK